jgi:hypothetical protein
MVVCSNSYDAVGDEAAARMACNRLLASLKEKSIVKT